MYLSLIVSIPVTLILYSIIVYILSLKFSGFPFLSDEARIRLNELSGLGSFWTFTRLVWGLVALTSVVRGWFIAAERSVEFYSAVLVCYEILQYRILILLS
jgi:hypothetical protein